MKDKNSLSDKGASSLVQVCMVTWVTHNSRISDRMRQYKVKKGDPVFLDEQSECKITEFIGDVVKEDSIKCLAYAICGDHVHMVLVCRNNELPGIVRKLKSVSARKYNFWTGATIQGKDDDNSLKNNIMTENNNNPEQGSLLPCDSQKLPCNSQKFPCDSYNIMSRGSDIIDEVKKLPRHGQAQNTLWAQKYNVSYIDTDEKLNKTINYVNTNRKKHNLPEIKGASSLVQNMVCEIGLAFERVDMKADPQ